ncbi:LuxR C-terminal-related transcriptional regulator [Nonomuraea guangzhouensis]|uniref:LuxR C-terminal-related transcriptional regulator n=1 Tax=Nonomuraea guangzhouensis TaxID=1291555 RepID=A0ABW4GYD1_9ACTN|nr:LuxR C-terminal-related transcriptional regulator [Nonomuraea guangzhouensis]
MLRIHFSAEDLARTRIADGPDPMWETLLSLHLLQERATPGAFGRWRADVQGHLPASAALLYELAPAQGYSADFLTPAETAGNPEFRLGIDAVLSTPRERLRDDIVHLMAERRSTPWLCCLADGGRAAIQRLGEALRQYHASALTPYWREISHRVGADRAFRAGTLLDHGLGRLLSTLHPAIRWEQPVLTFPYGRHDRDLHLDGRGLLLVPSFFCWRTPICLRDPSLAPVLVYPIDHAPNRAVPADDRTARTPSSRPWAAPSGRTHAADLGTTVLDEDLSHLDARGVAAARLRRRSPRQAAGPLNELTVREQQVLALMAQGRSNEAIIQCLGVGAKTVETYVRNIFAKLHLEPSLTDHRRVLAVLAYLQASPHPTVDRR